MATKELAQGLAGLGRNGDSMLMHVQPSEVAGLQALAKAQGTSLTINPETGLPEAFSLGGFFESLAPTIVGGLVSMIPGMQPFGLSAMQTGMLAGAATGALTNKKNPLLGGAMGALGGYGGANIAKGLGASAVQAGQNVADPLVQDQMKDIAMKSGSFQSNPYHVGLTPDAQTSQMMAGNTIESMGITPGGYGAPTPPQTFMGNLSTAGQNAGDILTGKEGAWTAFKENLGSAGSPVTDTKALMTAGLPLAGGVLGGLEPSDLGYDTIKPDNRGKYDPYSTLNLGGDTGLRLYASGGPVSFADGGPSDKLSMTDPVNLPGGGAGAMEGSGMLPLDVSDINAKYGYNPDAKGAASPYGNIYGGSLFGYGRVNVPVPELGLFASNDAIEAARTAYEQQLAAAMSGRGGMGIPYGKDTLRAIQGNFNSGNPMMSQNAYSPSSGMGATAKTAPTAETALSRLNLNKEYAEGGTISSGGIRDLYGSPDDQTNGVVLSRDGYGLGRLQAMADGGVAGYANGGETRYTLDRNTLGGKMFGDTGVVDKLPPAALAEILSNPGMRAFMGFKGVEEPTYYTASGIGGSPAMQGGGLNLNADTGYRLAKGGYLDGPGDGMSDSIPATIEGKQPARLADGEFVIPADVVSHLGNGSTKAGSQRLYGMLDKVRKARTGTKKQGRKINADKYLPA